MWLILFTAIKKEITIIEVTIFKMDDVSWKIEQLWETKVKHFMKELLIGSAFQKRKHDLIQFQKY